MRRVPAGCFVLIGCASLPVLALMVFLAILLARAWFPARSTASGERPPPLADTQTLAGPMDLDRATPGLPVSAAGRIADGSAAPGFGGFVIYEADARPTITFLPAFLPDLNSARRGARDSDLSRFPSFRLRQSAGTILITPAMPSPTPPDRPAAPDGGAPAYEMENAHRLDGIGEVYQGFRPGDWVTVIGRVGVIDGRRVVRGRWLIGPAAPSRWAAMPVLLAATVLLLAFAIVRIGSSTARGGRMLALLALGAVAGAAAGAVLAVIIPMSSDRLAAWAEGLPRLTVAGLPGARAGTEALATGLLGGPTPTGPTDLVLYDFLPSRYHAPGTRPRRHPSFVLLQPAGDLPVLGIRCTLAEPAHVRTISGHTYAGFAPGDQVTVAGIVADVGGRRTLRAEMVCGGPPPILVAALRAPGAAFRRMGLACLAAGFLFAALFVRAYRRRLPHPRRLFGGSRE